MKSKKIALILLILFAIQINLLYSQSVPSDLDKLFTRLDENNQFSGVVLIAHGDDIIFHKAFGLANREWEIQNTIGTKFNIQSITKTIIAVTVLKQGDKGLLNLDGKVINYLPYYKGSNGDKITIRQLLSHTSGLPEDLANGNIPNEIYRSNRLLAEIEKTKPENEPGTVFLYSAVGYQLLSIILEKVLGSDLPTILNKEIFQPLNMNNSMIDNGQMIIPQMAEGHNYHLIKGYQKGGYENMTFTFGNGGIVSTAKDLYNLNLSISKNQIISENSKRLLFTFNKDNYGLGSKLRYYRLSNKSDSIQIIYHNGGGILGYRAGMARIEKDGYLIILLENSERSFQFGAYNTNEITDLVLNILYNQQEELPRQSAVTEIATYVLKNGVDFALNKYKQIMVEKSDRFYFSKNELCTLGMQFRDDSVNLKILEFGMKEYPKSYNFYHSYADVLASMEDYNKAIQYYKKGLDVYHKYPDENEQYMKWINQAPEEIKALDEIIKKQK
jgi:CubicO group peptidase (beta-lactamase class C family)